MSSVQNNHTTINIYNLPPRTDINFSKTSGLSVDNTDFEHCGADDGDGGESGIDKLPLPAWAKALLKNMLGDSNNGLPSSADAAKNLRDFQKENDIGLLNSDQVKQMADTGYVTMPGGEKKLVPPDVQAAAQKMMDNNGELFKKLETAIRPEHDGLLSAADYDAALKDGSIGKPGTKDMPTEQALDMSNFLKSVMSGAISSNRPTEYNAAKTIQGFQQENNIKHLNIDQLQQMAETGYCKLPGGERVQVPPDVQAAAQKMMDNNCELFKKLETAIRKDPDGLLSTQDVDQAIQNGSIGQNNGGNGDAMQNLQQLLQGLMNRGALNDDFITNLNLSGNDSRNGLPSSADAAKNIQSFQQEHKIGLMSIDQVKQMADTGYCTLPSGERIQVPPDAQAAAMKMMDNNADLFKSIETAIRANHDGLLSAADYDAALKDGRIGKPGTDDLQSGNDFSGDDADMIQNLQQQFLQNLLNRIASSDDADDVGNNGNGLPAASDAAKTIQSFQKENKIGLMDVDQIKQMADTGYITMPGGEKKQVPPDVQAAAMKMMDNNGELFKSIETAIRANHDGLLSAADYDAALKDGRIGKPGTNDLQSGNDFSGDDADMIADQQQQFMQNLLNRIASDDGGEALPASSDAAKTIQTFQKEKGIDLMSVDQVQQMAETGYITMPGGAKIQVPPDVQAAAKKMMENNGDLFKSLETSIRANHDGLLSTADYDASVQDGRIGKPGTEDL